MMFSEYCCYKPVNPYWNYCPNCGKATNGKHTRDVYEADRAVELFRRRLEGLRSDDHGGDDVDQVREDTGGATSPAD